MKITQSFLKDMDSHINGEMCGNLIIERYIHGRSIDDPEAEPGVMQLGSYFEYIAFGSLPKSGEIPQPVYKKRSLNKKEKTIKDMAADYRFAHEQAEEVTKYLKQMGFVVIKTQWKLTLGRYEGTIDVLVRCDKDLPELGIEKGMEIVLDVKFTAMLKDTTPRNNKHGWKFSDVQKAYHGIQAVQYHMISKRPFYFLVVSSKVLGDVRLFYIDVDDFAVDQHVKKANYLYDRFMVLGESGLKPQPSLVRCNSCPIRKDCKDKWTYPRVEVIKLNED